MAKVIQNEYTPDYVSHPGETLLEVLEELGMTQAKLAERAGRPNKTINEIIKGNAAITPETALQLERVLGIPAAFWNNREKQYREYLARIEEQERLENEIKWVDNFPISAMAKLGWIENPRDKVQKLRNLLSFFGVASPGSWEETWKGVSLAFRQSPSLQSNYGSLTAWLRRGEVLAHETNCKPYERNAFIRALGNLRGLTVEGPEIFEHKMKEICANCGVAVVFVRELPGTRAWGATRWLSPDKCIIQLSLRYKSDDHLWFTFFHECCHVLKHGKRTLFIETKNGDIDHEKENEANSFAADFLIPKNKLHRFVSSGSFGKARIRRFAKELGIAPGIIVGRLQHDGNLKQADCNDLKRWFEWVRK